MAQGINVLGSHPRVNRRRFLGAAAVAATTAVLAACGAGGSTATSAPTSALPPSPTTGMAPTAAPPIAGNAPVATTVSGASSAAVATRPAGSAIAGGVSGTTASGSAAISTTGGIQTMVIEAFDYGFKTLGSIPGGMTRVQMKNTGTELHHGQFMRLNTGVTLDQLGAAFAKGPDAALGLVTQTGGPVTILPGGTSEVILDLTEGQYTIACFLAGDDHIPHVAKGMLVPLKVTAAPAAAAPASAVNGTITLFDFNFTMPDTLPAGKSMYTVTNTGAQFHEFSIGQLPPGKTVDDVKAMFAAPSGGPPNGPPPVIPMGGMNALTKGNTGIVVLDLTPGNYVAICLVPDQSKPNGDPHAHLGMIKGFTVTRQS